MTKIEIKPIFGKNSDSELIGEGKIVLKIFDDYLETVTSYKYNGYLDPEEKHNGKQLLIVHEQSFMKKSFISNIGIGFDNEGGCYYLAIMYDGKNNFFNVENISLGKDVLKQLTDWWLGIN